MRKFERREKNQKSRSSFFFSSLTPLSTTPFLSSKKKKKKLCKPPQRNVGNLAVHRDMNCMACLEYAVDALKVEHVVVCGHYGCGAVRGALELPSSTGGNVGHWISDIRATRDRNGAHLMALQGGAQARWDRLCELNVAHQVFNVCTSPVVQAAWERGQKLSVHGAIYSLSDGLLRELTPPMSSAADLDEAARAAERKVLLAAQGLSIASEDGEVGSGGKEEKKAAAAKNASATTAAAAIKVDSSCCSAGAGCGCGPAGASAAVLSGKKSGSASPTKGGGAAPVPILRRGGSCERLSELAPAFSLGTMLGAELGTHRWFESGGGSAHARKKEEEEEEKNGH